MAFLTPCDSCRRHVLSEEIACPFCGAQVTSAMRAREPQRPKGRLGRAAMMAIGATLAATPLACGGEDDNSSKASRATSQSGAGGEGGMSGMDAVGGAPPDTTRPMTPEGEPSAVALYGVAIMPEENRFGSGGASPVEPEPQAGPPVVDPKPAQGGAAPMVEPVAEPEPFAVAAYGIPPMFPEVPPVLPQGGSGGQGSVPQGSPGSSSAGGASASDAGASEPDPEDVPEPLPVADYGAPPLDALE